jgi:serine phosphatase RsbU (regulator of sigma subunit)
VNTSIGKRIWFGFGTLILLTLIVLFLTNRSANLSKRIYAEISEIYNPSVKKLNELSFKLEQSKILINYWAYVESKSDVQEKQLFRKIIGYEIPKIKAELDTLATNWDRADVDQKQVLYNQMDELFKEYGQIQGMLPEFNSYQEMSGMQWFLARDLTEDGGPIYTRVVEMNEDLDKLTENQRRREQKALSDMVGAFATLKFYSTYIGGFLIIAGLIIGLLTAKSIVTPVQRLKEKLFMMSRGVLPGMETRIASDEIGQMTVALNNLIQGQERIKLFVNALGSGDFTVHYDPLSEADELAPDFIKTRDALAENERITEMKIAQRTKELEEKNRQINEQSKRVIVLYQDLRDSIEYAKRLQDSILPTNEQVKLAFPDGFVFYQPKDIVSGDFYWVSNKGDQVYIAAIDCTGHGVPGAFMSLIGHNSLNIALDEADRNDPGDILYHLNNIATNSLNRNKGNTTVRDGMDAGLCMWNKSTGEVSYSGAMRSLIYFKGGKMGRIKGDRVSIGSQETIDHRFSSEKVTLDEGDTFYLFTDGYADQFGGNSDRGKKYKVARLLEDLEKVQSLDMEAQKEKLRSNIRSWQGNHPQVDDILVLGVKVT